MIDKVIANQSPQSDCRFAWVAGKTPHCATLSSPAAKGRNAVKTRAKGYLKLGEPISFTRLAGVPIKSASGASENRRKRKARKSISDAKPAFEEGSF